MTKNKNREFKQFVRKNRNPPPRGIVIAELRYDARNTPFLAIGWSYVNIKAGDKFNKNMAIRIARNRIDNNSNHVIPHEVMGTIDNVIENAAHYYKDINFIPSIAGKSTIRSQLSQDIESGSEVPNDSIE